LIQDLGDGAMFRRLCVLGQGAASTSEQNQSYE